MSFSPWCLGPFSGWEILDSIPIQTFFSFFGSLGPLDTVWNAFDSIPIPPIVCFACIVVCAWHCCIHFFLSLDFEECEQTKEKLWQNVSRFFLNSQKNKQTLIP